VKKLLDRLFPVRWEMWGDTPYFLDHTMPMKLRSRHRFYVVAWFAALNWVEGYRRGWGEAEIRPL
jgi:hypothetical protein